MKKLKIYLDTGYKTIVGVNAVNAINNYREIMIYEPTVMLERDDENE